MQAIQNYIHTPRVWFIVMYTSCHHLAVLHSNFLFHNLWKPSFILEISPSTAISLNCSFWNCFSKVLFAFCSQLMGYHLVFLLSIFLCLTLKPFNHVTRSHEAHLLFLLLSALGSSWPRAETSGTTSSPWDSNIFSAILSNTYQMCTLNLADFIAEFYVFFLCNFASFRRLILFFAPLQLHSSIHDHKLVSSVYKIPSRHL